MITFSAPSSATSGSNPSSSPCESSCADDGGAPSEPGDRKHQHQPQRQPFNISDWMHRNYQRRLAAAIAAGEGGGGASSLSPASSYISLAAATGGGCTPTSWSSSTCSSSGQQQHAPEMDEGEASHVELVRQLRRQQRCATGHDTDDAAESDVDMHWDDERSYDNSPHSLALSLEDDDDDDDERDAAEDLAPISAADTLSTSLLSPSLPLCPITPSKLAPRPTKSCLVVRVPSPVPSLADEHADGPAPLSSTKACAPFRSDSCSSDSSIASTLIGHDDHHPPSLHSTSSPLVTPASPLDDAHDQVESPPSLDVQHLHLRLVGDRTLDAAPQASPDGPWRLHVSASELEIELEGAEEYMIKGMLTRDAPSAHHTDISAATSPSLMDDWVEIEACHWQWLRPVSDEAAAHVCIDRGDGRTVKRRVRVHFPTEAGEAEGRLCSLYPTYSSVEYDRSPLEPPSAEERSCSLPERGSRRVQDDEAESMNGSDVESDAGSYRAHTDDEDDCDDKEGEDNNRMEAGELDVVAPIVSVTTPSDDCWEDWLDRRKSCKPTPCRPEPCTPSSTPAASSTPARTASPTSFARHIEILSFQCPSPTAFNFSELAIVPDDQLMLDAHRPDEEEAASSDTPSLASHTSTTTGSVSELAIETSPTAVNAPTLLEPISSASSSGDECNLHDSRTMLDIASLGQSPVDERMATWLPHSRGRRSYETVTDASDAYTEAELLSPLETPSPACDYDDKDTALPPTFFAPKLKRKKRASSGSRSPNARSGSEDSDSRRSCWASGLLSGCSSGFSSTAEDEGCLGGF